MGTNSNSHPASVGWHPPLLPEEDFWLSTFLNPSRRVTRGPRYQDSWPLRGPRLPRTRRHHYTAELRAPNIDTATAGLSESVISNHLKTRNCAATSMEESGNNICAVCRDKLYEGGGVVGILGCGHEYHEKCVKDWLRRNNTCPLCRSVGLTVNVAMVDEHQN